MLTFRAGYVTSHQCKQKTNIRICSSALNTLNGDLEHAVVKISEAGIRPLIAKLKFERQTIKALVNSSSRSGVHLGM